MPGRLGRLCLPGRLRRRVRLLTLRPEATAAAERAIDLFAAEIGQDPAEVRAMNLLPAFTVPHTTAFGAVYDSGDYPAALTRALDAAGTAASPRARRRRSWRRSSTTRTATR
jgi:CO/xanthine dehydrogenase Mo-binding subunit